MEQKVTHLQPTELPESEITMTAAQAFAEELFEEADNDSLYHHPISSVRDALAVGQCQQQPEEIAESILAWSGALR